MGFRENLKSELDFQGLYVKELAEKSNISRRTLDNYLRDNASDPTVGNAVKIAKALGVSVEYLVTGMDSATPRSIKSEVIDLINDINYLSDDDLKLVKDFVTRLKKPLK